MSDYVKRLFDLEGRVAAVIGGGGFLCGEMARGLAKAGVRVAVLDRNAETRAARVAEIEAEGGTAIHHAIDASDKASHEAALAAVTAAWGRVDILVNGAGINAPTPVLDITPDEFRAIYDSHALATLLGCQVFGAQMLRQGKGSIVNMSSASAGPPLSKAFTYSAAKAGVKNLTQNIAREWATRGVRVNALRPGFFPTEWSKTHFIDAARNAAILGHTPMGRYGEPHELVGALVWLCSDAAGFVTGAEIAVDGGFSCMTI